MNDLEIISLYVQRDEKALQETAAKYGRFCHTMALNILSVHEDAEECVNDTYLKAWNSIPPEEPDYLKGWLGKVVRNISLDLWRKNHRKKRYAGMESLFDELDECIPDPVGVEDEVERRDLTVLLSKWLASLPKNDRILFMRRYWYGESLKNIAKTCHATPTDLANRMYQLRQKLKSELKSEEVVI